LVLSSFAVKSGFVALAQLKSIVTIKRYAKDIRIFERITCFIIHHFQWKDKSSIIRGGNTLMI